MNYDLEHITDLSGTLITLDDSTVIPDVYIQMDSSTARKLASALRNNNVTEDNQELIFRSVLINKSCLDAFTKGQNGFLKDGNQYIVTTAGRNPIHFKGKMYTLVRGSDGHDYPFNIEIGNMVFNLRDNAPVIDDETAYFDNVAAMIYPHGHFQATVLQDEG